MFSSHPIKKILNRVLIRHLYGTIQNELACWMENHKQKTFRLIAIVTITFESQIGAASFCKITRGKLLIQQINYSIIKLVYAKPFPHLLAP